MTLDPRAKRLLGMMALSPPPVGERLTTQARRDSFAKLMDLGSKTIPIARSTDLIIPSGDGPMPVRVYDPQADKEVAAPTLIFFHGGGLVAGSIDTHDSICRRLANASGIIVLSVGYRLAPEARFPSGLSDAGHAIDWIKENASRFNINPQRIAIGGESAGALLATLCCNGHHPVSLTPRAQLLLCPVIDLAADFPSRTAYGEGYLIDRTTIARDIEDCVGPGASADELPSPLRHGKTGKSPATIMISAGYDPFRDEAFHYETHLRNAGVPVWHRHYPRMVHSFYGLPALLPQAEAALEEAGAKLAALLS
jgi:acetyl esterase